VSVWLPIGTLVGGYVLKTAEDWRKERRDDRRRDRDRELQLGDERRHRDADFQRETLLELQESLHDLIATSARSARERQAVVENLRVSWSDARSSAETNERQRELFARTYVLSARVKDARARELVEAVTSALASDVVTETYDDANRMQMRAWERFNELNGYFGELLRDVY